MGLFKKNPDPITDRSRELNAKISALELKIQKLSHELQPGPRPRLRSTAYPRGTTVSVQPGVATPRNSEPIFEKVDQNQLQTPAEPPAAAPHVSELGVRQHNLSSLWERIKKQFQAPPAANPKLLSYLAAGSIQGLRPLRYEKRVQRNRCVALVTLLVLVVFGILSYALGHHH
jgi:hypothetical protein